MSKPELGFWERPDTVERFAARKPDHRLQELLETRDPNALRILDIGCAAGRNTVYLAELGADIYAIDASRAMLAKTRARLSAFFSQAEAEQRIRFGNMENLTDFEDETFDLIVALGVYQDSPSQESFEAALKESARVLKKGGLCLVACFGPNSKPNGEALTALPDSQNQYSNFASDGRIMTLLDEAALDSSFAKLDLYPFKETYTVKTEFESGFRTTVNALYQKTSGT